jgi:hypothetical protein
LVAGIAAYMTATEQIDNYITFAGEANAMAFFGCCGVLSLIAFCGMFVPTNDNK